MAPNGMSTDGMSTSASIYCRIKPVCISPGERYSFPFTSTAAATATAIATASAAVKA